MSISFNLESDLAALSVEALADRLGKEQAQAKIAAQKAKDTQAEILARGVKSAVGHVYKFTVVDGGTRAGFDTSLAKTYLTQAQLDSCATVINVSASVRIYGA